MLVVVDPSQVVSISQKVTESAFRDINVWIVVSVLDPIGNAVEGEGTNAQPIGSSSLVKGAIIFIRILGFLILR